MLYKALVPFTTLGINLLAMYNSWGIYNAWRPSHIYYYANWTFLCASFALLVYVVLTQELCLSPSPSDGPSAEPKED